MTLVWAAVILAFFVSAFVFLIWDVGFRFRKNSRLIRLSCDRALRRSEDEAWAANRSADFELAQTITLTRAGLVTADLLAGALTSGRTNGTTRKLEAVR